MPKTEVVFFREESGTVPLLEWLDIKVRGLNLRILYFFNGRTAVVVSHGFVKQRADIPDREMRHALSNRHKFEARPRTHAFHGGI